MKHNDAAVLELFDAFLARPDLVWVELDRDVVELTTAIRVRLTRCKPPAACS